MTDEATTNMLMQFEATGGNLIPAECPLSISPNDKLATNQELAKGMKAGYYFLVSQFSFSAELHDSEKGADSSKRGSAHGGGGGGGPRLGGSLGGAGFAGASFGGGAGGTRGGALGRGGDHFDDFSPISGPAGSSGSGTAGGRGADAAGAADGKKPGAKQAGSFARWRSAGTDGGWQSDFAYPADIKEFSFTRLIDKASPLLFNACCHPETFPFVTFIKRKAAIAGSSIMPESLAYLRIDLANVLLTSIRWSDGDIVEETCQMKCQKMRIIYWQQNADSTLVPIGSVDWSSPVISPPSGS
jgi:type VI protein secretion system component Hcp